MTFRPWASCRCAPLRLMLAVVLATTVATACAGPLEPPAEPASPFAQRPARFATASLDTSATAPAIVFGDSLSASYLAGRAALDEGDLRLAAENFTTALARDPDNLELRRQIFTLRLGTGDYEKALDLAETLLERDPSADDARLMLVYRAVKAGDFALAREHLSVLGERDLAVVAKPVLSAWATFAAGEEAGEVDAAVASLRQGGDEDGLERVRLYHAALMLTLAGRVDEALAIMRPMVEPAARNPVRVSTALAAMEVEGGDAGAAERLLRAQLALEPDNIVLETALDAVLAGDAPALAVTDPASGMADALFSLARALDDQNARLQALLLARMAGYLAPEQGDIAILVALINLGEENPAEAVRALASVPSGSPYAWEARLLEAQSLAAMERDAEAVARLDAMARERPERIDALVAKGDILRRQERYAEAEQAYDGALDRVAEIAHGYWPLLYSRGISRERIGRWPEAEADFLKALELEPEQPLVLNYLGYSWVDKGLNLTEAEAMLRRAVELRPDDGYIVDSLGWAYFRLGRIAEAVDYLERAVELRPDDPVINDHLGDAYWRIGREREARFQWRRALTFEPEADQVALIERKLERGLEADEAGRG